MVIVTGASGFIGSAIAKQLGKNVIKFSHANAPSPLAYQLDLTDTAAVEAFIQERPTTKVTAIIHCAGIAPWQKNPDFKQDLSMAKNIQLLCKKFSVGKLVFLSGWVVYSSTEVPPIAETASLLPATPYGKSKLTVESFFKRHLSSTAVVNLRLASVYGPGQVSSGLIPNLIKSAFKSGAVSIDALETKRDYLYIEDLTKAIKAVLSPTVNENSDINLGSGQSVSVEHVANSVRAILKKRGKQVDLKVSQLIKESVPIDNQLSIKKAVGLGLLKEPTSFEAGLEKYINWVHNANIL